MPSDVLITPATSKIDFTDGANSTKKLSISGTAFSFNSNLNVLSSTSLSSAFKAEGVNGTLFEVTDDLSNSLMSVNTIGGLPVFEVFANNSIIGGQYGANDFVISGNKIGLGYANPVNKLSVSGSVSIGSSYNVAAPSNGLIVQGSVGIGITNPTAKLDVAGGGLSVSGWSNNNSGSTGGVEIGWDGTQGIFQVYDRVNNNYEPILINGSAIQFFISGGLKWTLTTAGVLQSNNAQTIQTSTGNLTLATAAGDGHVLLSPHNNGNVGIGTASPGQKLEVNGRGLFTGATVASASALQVTAADASLRLKWTSSPVADKNTWDIRSVGTGATPCLQFRTINDANTVFTNRVAFTNDGDVGIGTITPAYKLDVNGTARFSGDVRLDSGVLLNYNGYKTASIYIKGVGGNFSLTGSARAVVVNGNALAVGSSRGLVLTILKKIDFSHISSTTYDTYGSTVDSDALAVVLNNMTSAHIGILTSSDAFNASFTENLRTVTRKLGLSKLSQNGGSFRRPYAAIFMTSNSTEAASSGVLGTSGVTLGARYCIEDFEFTNGNSSQAVIHVMAMTDGTGQGAGFSGNQVTTALYGTGDTTDPIVLVDSSGNVGIGTSSPATLLQIGTGTPTSATGGIQFGSDTTARIYRVGAGNIQISDSLTVGGTITGNLTGNVTGTAASETFATVTGRGSGTTTQISVGTTSAGSMFTGEKIGSGYSDNLSGATFKSITNHPTGASFAFAAYYGGLLGTNSFYVSAEGGAYFKSNVGIGTSTANNKLVVVAGGDVSGINLSYDGAGNNRTGLFAWTRGSSLASLGGGVEYTAASTFTARSTAASYVEFGSGETRFYGNASLTSGNGFTPTERVRISAIGNVGIGTTAPYTNLDVQGLTDASLGAMGLQSQLSVSDSRNQIAGVGGGISFTGKYITSNATQTVFGLIRGAKANSTTANVVGDLELYAFGGSFKFHSQYNQLIGSNAVLMTLTDVGNLGIGITNPADKLHVIGNIRINGGDILNWSGQAFIQTIGANDMFFRPNSTLQMILTAGGNLGVGNGFINPLAKLHLNSTTSGATLLRADGTNGTLFSVVDDLSDSLMSVNNSAGLPVLEVFADDRVVAGQYGANDFVLINNKLGLGTNSPAYKLDVRGSTVNARVGLMEFGSWPTNTTYIYLQHNTLSSIEGAYGFLQGPTGETFVNAASGQTLHFRIGNSEKWAVLSTGVLQSDGLQTIRTSTGNLTLATNGTNGHIILSPHGTGNVGIGTTTPTGTYGKLSVAGGIRILDDNNAKLEIGRYSSGASNSYIKLGSNSNSLRITNNTDVSDIFTIENGGNVGIGTTSPAVNLHVRNASSGDQTLLVLEHAAGYSVGTENRLDFYDDEAHKVAARIAQYFTNEAGNRWGLKFYTNSNTAINSTPALTLMGNNNVGIGKTTPNAKLNVLSTSSLSSVFKTEGVNGTLFEVTDDLSNSLMSVNTIGGLPVLEVFANNSIIAGQYGQNDFVISGNKVGIGTASPSAKLQISGAYPHIILNNPSAGSGVQILLQNNGAAAGFIGHQSAASKLQFSSTNASVSHMTIDSNGNIGIGTVGPGAKLEIAGFSTGAGLKLNYGNSSGSIEVVNFIANGAANGVIGMQMVSAGVGDLWLGGSGGRILTLYRDGNVGIGAATPAYKLDVNGTGRFSGDLTANVTGNLAGTATIATTANALNTGNSYTVTNLTATNEIGTRSTNIGANLERGDATVTTLRFDSDNFRFYGGGTGGIGEVLRITEGGSVGIGTTSTLQKLHVLGNTVFGNFGRNTYKYNLYLSFEAAADESWIRIYLPQDYSSTNNGGTVKVRVLWAGDHATFGAHEEYQISYKTYYPSPYLAFSNIICTNKTTDFAGATYYPASSTPNSIFYSNGSAYLYIKIKGYYGTINTTRFIEAEVFGRVAAVPTIETTTAPASPTELLKTIQFLPQEGNVIITGSLTGSLIGNVTGNVTGNVSGSSGTCNGLAASATTAATCTGNAAGLSATLAVASGGTGGNTQALGRAGLGATTLGANLFTLADPGAETYVRVNAANTVTLLNAADFRAAIGAGTGGGSGTVTGVTASAPLAATAGNAPVISLSGAVALANGGSGQTSAQAAMNAFAGAVTNTQYLRGNGTNVVMSAIQVVDVPILNQNTTGSSASCSGTAATANALNTANNYTVAQMTVSTSATPSSYVIHTGTSPSAIRLLAYTDSTYIQSGTSTSSSSADLVFSSMQAGAEWMRIKGATGRLGIGTSTPAYLLDVNGTIHYTTLTASSDGRFKKNVQPIPNALDRLSYIRGVKFEWNEFINDRRNGYELNKPTFGVIAQELEEVFPELITLWKLSDDCTDARSVNYEKIIPILIEAVKELNDKNKLLESRLLILENK